MRAFDPVSLRLFIAVSEEGSIALAAEREAIAPSAISKRLAGLEHQARTELLRRGRRGVELTPAGEALLRHAREVLQSMDRMHAELSEFASGVQGHVRVFASMSAVLELLPDDIGAFVRNHETVRVSLDEMLSAELVRGVEDGQADFGVCWNAVDLRSLRSLPYRSDHLAVAVHPEHPLAQAETLAFEDTLDFEHVGIRPGGLVHLLQQRQAALAEKTIRYRIQVGNFDAACRIVSANLGLAVIPREVIARFERFFGLRMIPLTNDWACRDFVICMRSESSLTVPARLLLDSMRARTESS